MKLRDYQQKAIDAIFNEWEDVKSTLLVLPTGAGKTIVFTSIIKRVVEETGKRVMVLVHRTELVEQAVEKLQALGMMVGIEKADQYVQEGGWAGPVPVVVSTVQTQISGGEEGRMLRFKPNDFALVVADESHHATSKSWSTVIEYYQNNPDLKVLGVTATPDRADEAALGKVFETVAFDYEILDAIKDGWLVPIRQQLVTIDGLDFSAVKTTAGDLNGADLAAVMEMEKNLHGVVSATIQIIGNRNTIVFAVSVKQAEMYSEIFNRHKPGMADWVCGKTSKEERAKKLAMFKRGEIQVMVNVGVLTEGFDSPSVEVIVQARPTKSRALYSQMVGRSTRPLPGVVDAYDTPDARREAIAFSMKPHCLVVDFAGNSGKHKLMTSADILGGKFSDEEIDLAEKTAKAKGGEVDMIEEMEDAKAALEARRLAEMASRNKVKATAKFTVENMDPFNVLQITPERERGWDSGKFLTDKQLDVLKKNGINPSDHNYHQQKQILNELFSRMKNKKCTFKQAKTLQRFGYDTKTMLFTEASKTMDALAKNGWNRQRADDYLKNQKLPPAA